MYPMKSILFPAVAATIVLATLSAAAQTLTGVKVEQFATGLDNPRLMRLAPNGDIFLAESTPGKILVFRGIGADGKAGQTETFATGQKGAFGINFYPAGPNPQWVYVGNTT